MAIKNQALTVTYYAWDTSNLAGKTGDSANHTIYVSIDGVANAADNSPAEVDSTNLPGMYSIALTADEMNGNHIMVGGKSSTSDIIIVPTSITTERGDLATVDTNVDAILVDTAALNDTALPDSVPADGSLPTLKQAVYMIVQFLTERAVSSTTVTVKKVDGSTSLMTFTLDDGTSPTSITRAS